jgi:transposase
MDVHSKKYTLCALEPKIGEEDCLLASVETTADYKNILAFIIDLKLKLGYDNEYDIVCGYEAGCLGYSLYNQLTSSHVKCVILAPTTMLTPQGKRVKTDARDARMIAQCLGHGGYHSVYIPDEEDASVKEYIRMRDDHKSDLTKLKQRIDAFCLHNGRYYEKQNWTLQHMKWLRTVSLPPLVREALDEYLASFDNLTAKIERLDNRIEELAGLTKYREKVKRLICLLGVKTHTALSLIVETGDFTRFEKGNTYGAFLGLAPGENSSGDKVHRTGISKAGNSHLRKLLIEAAHGICKGRIGFKSKALRARQQGSPADVIEYADRANTRMRAKYYRMIRNGKKYNVAVASVARELACFVWGLMTDNIYLAVS